MTRSGGEDSTAENCSVPSNTLSAMVWMVTLFSLSTGAKVTMRLSMLVKSEPTSNAHDVRTLKDRFYVQ